MSKLTMTRARGIKTIQPLVLRSENEKAASTMIHIRKPMLRKGVFGPIVHAPRDG
jgi:hypothetical protein